MQERKKCAHLFYKGNSVFGMLVIRIVLIFGSPGKNYIYITLCRRKMKEMVFISGSTLFNVPLVLVSFLHQTINCLRLLLGFAF